MANVPERCYPAIAHCWYAIAPRVFPARSSPGAIAKRGDLFRLGRTGAAVPISYFSYLLKVAKLNYVGVLFCSI